MKLHRFIGNFDFSHKILKIMDTDLINQLRNVLRFSVGDKILLGDGKTNEAKVEIKEINKKFIKVEIIELRLNKNEPQNHIILYCAILKRENFELVVQKATEIGVKEIVPLICGRTIKFGLKNERLEKIIKEAAEQSERGIVPKLGKAISYEKAVLQAQSNDLNLIFDASGSNLASLKLSLEGVKRIGIFIGPEGGWDVEEIENARNADNFKIANLGKLTLRAETAAIIAPYLAVNF